MESAPADEATLFARIGGETGLVLLIDRLMVQLLADDYLSEYFMGVDIDRLKAGLAAFLRKAFGDTTAEYRGSTLQAAHKGQLVTEHAFDQFIDVFIDAARENGVAVSDQAEIRSTLQSLRASVITEFEPNPAYDYKSKPF